jgi:urocanate hydratase
MISNVGSGMGEVGHNVKGVQFLGSRLHGMQNSQSANIRLISMFGKIIELDARKIKGRIRHDLCP